MFLKSRQTRKKKNAFLVRGLNTKIIVLKKNLVNSSPLNVFDQKNWNLNKSNVISIRPEVEVSVSDDETSPSVSAWWRHVLQNDGLNGGRPPHDVIAQNGVGVDATFEVRKPFVRLERFGDDDASVVEHPETTFAPKTGHALAHLRGKSKKNSKCHLTEFNRTILKCQIRQ